MESYIVLALVVLVAGLALRSLPRSKGDKGCGGDCGRCKGCH